MKPIYIILKSAMRLINNNKNNLNNNKNKLNNKKNWLFKPIKSNPSHDQYTVCFCFFKENDVFT